MRLTVPKRYRDGFAALLGYEDHQLEELGKRIEESDPATSLPQLTKKLAATTEIKQAELADVVDAVASLYGFFADTAISPEELIAEIRDALAREKEEHPRLDPDAGNWMALESFLLEVLRLDSPLALTAKAAVLRMDVERLYCTSKTLSDLRPIFKSDSEQPAAMLALHTLQISYHLPDFELAEFSVVMTERHLRKLRDVVDRALRKHEQLRLFADSAKVPFIEEPEN